MKFVHIADLHIGQTFQSASFGSQFGAIKRQAVKENLKAVVTYCNQNAVDFLLMAGDCIEADHVQMRDWLDLRYLFESLDQTRVIMIGGNHDPVSMTRSSIQAIQWPSHVTIVENDQTYLVFEQEDVGFFCMSWQEKQTATFDYDYLEEVLAKTPVSKNIGIFHGDIYQEKGYMPLDKKKLLKSKLDYVALGHIHKQDIIDNKIAYPGSLEPLDFSETGNHGFILGSFKSDGLRLETVTQMVHPMKIHELNVTSFSSTMEIVDKIKQTIKGFESKDMVRLVLTGEMEEPFSLIKTTAGNQWSAWIQGNISYLEVIDQTVGTMDLEQIYRDHEEDIIGYYIHALKDKAKKETVYQEALELGVKMLLNEIK